MSGPGRSAGHGDTKAPNSGAGLSVRRPSARKERADGHRASPLPWPELTCHPRGPRAPAPHPRGASRGCPKGPHYLPRIPAVSKGPGAPHCAGRRGTEGPARKAGRPRPPRHPRPTRSRSPKPPAPHPSPPATAPGHTIPQTQPKMCTPTAHTDPHEDTPFQGHATVLGHPQLHHADKPRHPQHTHASARARTHTHTHTHTHTLTHAESPIVAHASAHAGTLRSPQPLAALPAPQQDAVRRLPQPKFGAAGAGAGAGRCPGRARRGREGG